MRETEEADFLIKMNAETLNPTVPSPYLEGNFAPVRQEITNDDLKVIGELPADLSGIFVRNGPNPQFTPIGQYHWFDGDGMLHGVRIQDGKASYLNRYVQTRGFQIEREATRAIWSGLLEPMQFDNPHGPSKNTANTALVYHDHRLLATWEGGAPHEIALPNLETVGEYTYNGKLSSAFTAHPKVDPETGEMMFFGYSLAQPPYLKYSVVSAQGELLRTVPIELPVGVMMHDFAITQNYSIFMDLPLVFDLKRLQKNETALAFDRNRPSRFGIIPRHGDSSEIRWFEGPPCYVFHTLNAYEEGDEVVLIACRMSHTMVLMDEMKPHDPEGDTARLHRWRFNLKTGEMKEEPLDEVPSDFPRINEQWMGRKTRYGYTAKLADRPSPLFDGIIKYDLERDRSSVHSFGPGRFGGEAVFVPRPQATAEDAGWLITFVYDEAQGTSELVIVDAQEIESEPVARVMIPQRVPYGFHGMWVDL